MQSLDAILSVPGFNGEGKVNDAKLLFKEKAYQQTLAELGMQPRLSEDILIRLEKYVRHLYGQRDCADINTTRYNLFTFG